jgi:GR25 family glycosyltransferase involved in LPS biosynthesis
MVLGADSAYIIHLKGQTFRKRRMDNLIKNLKLDNINWVDAVNKDIFWKDTWGKCQGYFQDTFWDPNGMVTMGILACALSHRKAYKTFLDSGDEVGLFLEDDIRNTSYIHKLDFNKIREELDSIDNWGVAVYGRYKKDILYKGKITDHWCENYYHGKQTSGHAYALNRKSAQWLYDNTEKIGCAADVLLELAPFRIITLPQSVFIQRYMDYTGFDLNYTLKMRKKYPFLKEFLSATTIEARDHLHTNIYRKNQIVISKYVPAEKWERKERTIQGRKVPGVNITIGRRNEVFKDDLNSPPK